MLFTRKILIIIFVSIFTNFAHAQSIGQPNELDEQYTPKGTGPLSAVSKSNNSSKNYNSDYPKNIIKFTPTSLVRSLVILNYERNLSDNFSVTGGLGFNFNKDIIYSVLGSEMNISGYSSGGQNEQDLNSIMNKSSHNGISPYFSGGVKLVYESLFWENFGYIEFLYYNYANKLNYELETSSSSTKYIMNGSPALKINFSHFAMKWGTQFQTEGKIKTTHELFLIAGLRTATHNVVSYTVENNYSSSYYSAMIYNIESRKVKSSSILFGFGYTFGIGF